LKEYGMANMQGVTDAMKVHAPRMPRNDGG